MPDQYPVNSRKKNANWKKPIQPQTGARHNEAAWRIHSTLFPELNQDITDILDMLPKVLELVWPLSKKHRQALPADIAQLSRLLTSERGNLDKPYWCKPGFTSAYLYYFFPWNLIRLARLFSGLDLPEPVCPAYSPPLLLDAGSGPLTVPVALWIAKPRLRARPLHVLALDRAKQPLELGIKVFSALGRMLGYPAWHVHAAADPLESLPKHLRMLENRYFKSQHALETGVNKITFSPWLLTAANILNEIRQADKRRELFACRDACEDDMPDDGTCLEAGLPEDESPGLYRLLDAWSAIWTEHAAKPLLLFVEPGTRLGGTTIMNLRQCALRAGLTASAPCPHNNPCPLLGNGGQRRDNNSSLAKRWCHFTFAANGVPAWLKKISSEAGLTKQSLSISPLLLSTGGEPITPRREKGMGARVISRPFEAHGLRGMARYACARCGLGLLPESANTPAGSLVAAGLPHNACRDKKSGAIILSPAEQDSKNRYNGNTDANHARRSEKTGIKSQRQDCS